MVTDQHDISNFKIGVESSSSIGDHQRVHTQKMENSYWEGHLRCKRSEKIFRNLTNQLKGKHNMNHGTRDNKLDPAQIDEVGQSSRLPLDPGKLMPDLPLTASILHTYGTGLASSHRICHSGIRTPAAPHGLALQTEKGQSKGTVPGVVVCSFLSVLRRQAQAGLSVQG